MRVQLSPSSRQALVMLLFGVFVPSLDQYSDMSLVVRLMSTVLNSCKAEPTKVIKVTKVSPLVCYFSVWQLTLVGN